MCTYNNNITNSYYSALIQFYDQFLYYFIFIITFEHEVTFSIGIRGLEWDNDFSWCTGVVVNIVALIEVTFIFSSKGLLFRMYDRHCYLHIA